MNGARNVVELWSDPSVTPESPLEQFEDRLQPDSSLTHSAETTWEDQADEPMPRRRRPLLLAFSLGFIAFAWITFAVIVSLPALRTNPFQPANIGAFVALTVPTLAFLAVIWLMLRGTPVTEQEGLARLLDTLRSERQTLAALIADTDTRLRAGVEAIHAQGEQLDAVGEATLNRVATLRVMLGEEIGQIGLHSNTLKNAAAAARSDMAVLLANLPKAHIETRKIAASLQDAGSKAQEHTLALNGHLATLSKQGEDAQVIASGAAEALANQLTQMESQSFAMRSLVQQSQAALAKSADEGVGSLQARLKALNQQIDTFGLGLATQDGLSTKLFDTLRASLADIEGRLAVIDTHGSQRTERLAVAIQSLTEHSHVLRDALTAGGDSAETLIGKAEALMVALDASAREIDETLPAAFARLQQIAQTAQDKIHQTNDQVSAMDVQLAASHRVMDANTALAATHAEKISAAHQKLQDTQSLATALSELLAACDADLTKLTQGASVQLVESMIRVRETAQQASERARQAIHEVIPAAAEALGKASHDAMNTAMSGQIETQMARVTQVAQQAVDSADRATERLMRQMLTITETSATFQAQLDAAAQAHEGDAQTSLSRRVSLLIESLNSISIDVTKILSNEVTDAAWSSYLKGDRGIFTRRAVRLIDTASARDIVKHYDSDMEFRAHVNHYIHDFEAMLRTVLSSRESGPLSVTLLSSDMGKLYVALAHAIERLRT